MAIDKDNSKIMDFKGMTLRCKNIINDTNGDVMEGGATNTLTSAMNGTLGATTPAAATVTTLTTGGATIMDGGTVTINEASGDYDFRVESNGNANAIFVDAGNDRVGILNGSPATALDVTGTITCSAEVAAADLSMTGVLKLDTVSQALTMTIALAAGATNHITATYTMKDMAGATVTGVQRIEAYISEGATGIGLTADSASGALTASTGTILTAITAKKHAICLTDANGVLVLDLEDTAEPTDQYFVGVRPFGSLVVSAASGTSWG